MGDSLRVGAGNDLRRGKTFRYVVCVNVHETWLVTRTCRSDRFQSGHVFDSAIGLTLGFIIGFVEGLHVEALYLNSVQLQQLHSKCIDL